MERVKSRRDRPKREKLGMGGRRRNAGRKKGGVSEFKRVAQARARQVGGLPHELLFKWASTGIMEVTTAKGKTLRVELEPADRISCAKGCAAWYAHPKAAARPADEKPPVVNVTLDESVLRSLAARRPDKLELLRDVIRMVGAAGADVPQIDLVPSQADPSRYGAMLSATSSTRGSA